MPQGCHNAHMGVLKDQMRTDLTASIKSGDKVRSSTLRMVLDRRHQRRGRRQAGAGAQ